MRVHTYRQCRHLIVSLNRFRALVHTYKPVFLVPENADRLRLKDLRLITVIAK